MLIKVFLLLFVCLFSVCGNSTSPTENTNQIQSKEKTELFLRMERSGCYGACPIYNLIVQPSGKVLFDGKVYTETLGNAESFLDREKIERLIAEIEKADFYSLKDFYTTDSGNCPSTSTDSATVKISIKLNSKEKKITHYLGCTEIQESIKVNPANLVRNFDPSKQIFPQQLYNLENKIDEIIETKRWIGERK